MILVMFICTIVGAWICWSDWLYTRVNIIHLAFLVCTALAIAVPAPFSGTPFIEHLIGAALGTFVAWLVRYGTGLLTGREAFGEADVWVAGIGGGIVGMQWLGPWFLISSLLGAALFFAAHREDTEEEGRILPFLPVFLLSMIVIMWGRYLDILPPRPF